MDETTPRKDEKVDVANEPVDSQEQDDDGFMDTGVYHEPKGDKAVEEEDVE